MARQQGKTAQKFKSITVTTGPFRMAFPSLLEPEETDNGERFKVTMLFQPDSKDIPIIEDAMDEVMRDRFGPPADWPNGKRDTLPEDKFFDAGKYEGKWAGYKKGWMALSASSVDQPGVIDIQKKEVMSRREVYGGRWARAQIVIASFDNQAKGVTAYLNHVQLLEHDEAFSGKGDASKAFDDDYTLADRGNGRDRDGGNEDRGREESRGRDRGEDREADRARGRSSRDEGTKDGDDRDTRSTRDDRDDTRRTAVRGRDEDTGSRTRDRDRGEDRDPPREREEGRSRRGADGERDERGSSRSGGRASRDADDQWN